MEENTCLFWRAHDANSACWRSEMGEGWLHRETAGGLGRHGDTSKIVAGVRATGGFVEAHLGTRRAICCCRECAEAWRSRLGTCYRGHQAGVVVYNCWPPLPYHHLHFSGPPSPSSHPLHYPGDPDYVNSVASEMSVDRPTSQVAAGCCSTPRTRGVGGTGNQNGLLECCWELAECVKGLLRHSAVASSKGTYRLVLLFLATCSSGSAITSGIKNVF